MSRLPFKSQILRGDIISLRDHDFKTSEIVERLASFVTTERIKRIDDVIEGRTFNIATVTEDLYDIGNISAVMRSAESFGFLPFHIIDRPEAKYKMSDRVSKGTEKWLDIRKSKGPEACIEDLKTQGFKIFATDLNATHKIEDIDFSQKVAVVFGNEKEGISSYIREHADGRFKIPMNGFAQSFNISVAAALCFYHIHREREKALGQSGDLSPSEKMNLKAHYFLRTLDSSEDILLSSVSS